MAQKPFPLPVLRRPEYAGNWWKRFWERFVQLSPICSDHSGVAGILINLSRLMRFFEMGNRPSSLAKMMEKNGARKWAPFFRDYDLGQHACFFPDLIARGLYLAGGGFGRSRIFGELAQGTTKDNIVRGVIPVLHRN